MDNDLKVRQLVATLNALPIEATLDLDYDSSKFDVYVGARWIGGIWISGDKAGQFYTAKSIGYRDRAGVTA